MFVGSGLKDGTAWDNSESALARGLFAPGAIGVEPRALDEEFFAAFERAAAVDPEAGRYEAYVLAVILARR